MNLRDFTSARVGLGRVGASLPTRELLDFQLAHAQARDAVHAEMDSSLLARELSAQGLSSVRLRSRAGDRGTYLRRPDLGRQLDAASKAALAQIKPGVDLVFVLADGLSALAVHRHALPLLEELSPSPNVPIVVLEQGRVAAGDEIGFALGARILVMLIGERPGLSSPDSLGAYMTWNPKPGRSDAERNCLSNIRLGGLEYASAAHKLRFLIAEAGRRELSGVQLKEEAAPLLPELS